MKVYFSATLHVYQKSISSCLHLRTHPAGAAQPERKEIHHKLCPALQVSVQNCHISADI